MPLLQRIETKIVNVQLWNGVIVTNLLHEYEVDGVTYYTSSRVSANIANTVNNCKAQDEAFRARFDRHYP